MAASFTIRLGVATLLAASVATACPAQIVVTPAACEATTPAGRQRCQQLLALRLRGTNQTAQLADDWQLVKSLNPYGGAPIISVMHASDTAKSDINLAGLVLRCAGTGFAVSLIVVDRMRPSSAPAVKLKYNDQEMHMTGSITASGDTIVLPPSTEKLIDSEWRSGMELGVEISSGKQPVKGIIPLRGLAAAAAALRQNCTADASR